MRYEGMERRTTHSLVDAKTQGKKDYIFNRGEDVHVRCNQHTMWCTLYHYECFAPMHRDSSTLLKTPSDRSLARINSN